LKQHKQQTYKTKEKGGKMKASGIIILIITMYYTFKQVKEFYRIAKKEIEEQKKED
jgi:hypothetical protein